MSEVKEDPLSEVKETNFTDLNLKKLDLKAPKNSINLLRQIENHATIWKNSSNSKVKVHAIGGYGQLVANMTVLVYDKSLIIIDSGKGMTVPKKMEYLTPSRLQRIDPEYPNFNYLDQYIKKGYKIEALVITHPHGDHIAGAGQLFQYLKSKNISKEEVPVYLTQYTLNFAKKMQNTPISQSNSTVLFDQQLYRVANNCLMYCYLLPHSTVHSAALYFSINGKKVLFHADHKFDHETIRGPCLNESLAIFKSICKQKPDCFILEATCPQTKEEPICESAVYYNIKNLIKRLNAKGAKTVIFSTYSTHPTRLQAAINAAIECKRKVGFIGKSIWNGFRAAKESDLLNLKKGVISKIENIQVVNENKQDWLLITTGHMGEASGGLSKLLNKELDYNWDLEDKVIIASRTIPKEGPILCRAFLEANLMARRLKFYTGENTPGIHTTGHIGYQDYLYYIDHTNFFKTILINHSDLENSLKLYPMLAKVGKEAFASKYKILLNGQEHVL